MRLFLKEIKDRYIQENFKMLQASLGGVTQNVVNNNTTVVTAADNFSYNYIISTQNLLIPENQQMIVQGKLTNDGIITNDGSLVIL